MIEKLLTRAEHQPNQPIYYFFDSSGKESANFTYESLLNAVQRIGLFITEQSQLSDRIAIMLPTEPAFVATFLACLFTHRIPVPLSQPTRRHGCEYYQQIFSDCDARLIITDPSTQTVFEKEALDISAQILTLPSLETLSPLLSPVDEQTSNIAFLQYTSGSTSFPKGVIVSHENIVANNKMIQHSFGHSSATVMLGWVPLFHDMGLIGCMLQPLYVGFLCYLMSPATFIQRPKLWLKAISEKKVTTTGGPNFAYDLCVKRIEATSIEGLELSSWEVAYNGAEHIKPITLEQFSEKFAPYGFKKKAFLPCYGLAEATLIVSGTEKHQEPSILEFLDTEAQILDANALQNTNRLRLVVSSGKIVPELCVRIINPKTLTECSIHHIGEIWVAGPSITLGYWQKPEKTQENFVVRDGLRFLRTGDLGFLDDEGKLYVTGRLKDLIIIDGENYYPQDIEETVKSSHPAIHGCHSAVFSVDRKYFPKLVVVTEVEREFRHQVNFYADEIKEAIKNSVLNHYQLTLHDIVLLPINSLPQTTSGKIQRQKTKSLYLSQQLKA
ncbi:Acyl-CoA synthetase [Nostoc flagelliforme CCNUN1]|uniref:Acyl-CoA synthetase n=1 Tax=Nostoc flagelliforme CCNUN1 TaxID=2038116 RepID=A0A2K8SRI2_9NOSO|nr:Acyl-CoA synthetase [Nostoc flagelliforme CCNUN1]